MWPEPSAGPVMAVCCEGGEHRTLNPWESEQHRKGKKLPMAQLVSGPPLLTDGQRLDVFAVQLESAFEKWLEALKLVLEILCMQSS